MFRLKNPDGTLGALVSDDVDVSGAEIISDEFSEITGTTKIEGGPLILKRAKIENCKMDITISSAIFDSTIKDSSICVGGIIVEKSVIGGIIALENKTTKSVLNREEVENKQSMFKIISSSVVGGMFFDFRGKNDFAIVDSRIKGDGCFICLGAVVKMTRTTIENLKETTANGKTGLPDCNFYFKKNAVDIDNVFVSGKGKILCKPGAGMKIENVVVKNALCVTSGIVKYSIIKGTFVSFFDVKINKLETEDKTEIALIGLPYVYCEILNVKIKDSAMIENKYVGDRTFPENTSAILKLKNSIFSGFSRTYVTKSMTIDESTVSDESVVEGANLLKTTVRGQANVAGVTIEKSVLSNDASVGYDPFGAIVSTSELMSLKNLVVNNRIGFIMYKTRDDSVITFQENLLSPVLYEIDRETGKFISRMLYFNKKKIAEFAKKISEKFPESVFADSRFDVLDVLSASMVFAAQKVTDEKQKNNLKNIVMYELIEKLKSLSDPYTTPPEKTIDWLNRLKNSAKIDIRTKQIIGYNVVFVPEVLEQL